jgi:hypothetical protein
VRDGSQRKSSKKDGYLEITGILFIKLSVMGIGAMHALIAARLLVSST